MKKTIPALCIGFVLCFVLNAYMDNTKTALANGVIRLHVVANSDSAADQALKLKVRDRILGECSDEFSALNNIDAVSADICTSLPYIKKLAEDEIAKNGYNYSVDVSYGTQSFPRKSYGDITFPEGDYQALKVVIGEGSGKNWWCVLFPRLCTDLATSKEEQFVAVGFTPEQYKIITESDTATYKIRFRLLEFFEELGE